MFFIGPISLKRVADNYAVCVYGSGDNSGE